MFLFAAAYVIRRERVPPHWLAWLAGLIGTLFITQGFGLGGIIATFRPRVDIIGFLLLLVFILTTSIIMLRRRDPAAPRGAELA